MEHEPFLGTAPRLILVFLVLAPVSVSKSPQKLKVAAQILVGILVGFILGIAIGTAVGSDELAAALGFQLMWLGGIWVSVRKIRRSRNRQTAPLH